MTVLAPREAYRLWSETYEAENAVSWLEQQLVAELGPAPVGLRLLDVGCGTGRRLVGAGARHAVGVDLSADMLAVGRRNPRLRDVELIEGDVCALPVPERAFDVIWCRLVLGHVADLSGAYRELARMTAASGRVVVTDFHPAAWAAGHRRSFRHAGEVHEVVHFPRTAAEHADAAQKAGLRLTRQGERLIGPEVREFYREGGRDELYADHLGLPVVLGLAFVRDG